MRIGSLIDDQAVIERILRHLGLWLALCSFSEVGQQGVRVVPGPDPPGDWVIEPCLEDVYSDYVAYANE